MTSLNDTIGRARRRRLVDRALERGGRGLVAASCAGLVLLTADRIVPLDVPVVAYAALIALGIAAGAAAGLVGRPRQLDVAVGLDRTLRLADRLGSAAAIEASGSDPVHDPGFRLLLDRDAQALAGRIDVGHATPIRVRGAWARGLTLALALWLGAQYLPARRVDAEMQAAVPDRARVEDESAAREALVTAIDEAVQTLAEPEALQADDPLITEQLQALSSLSQQLKGTPNDVGDLAAARDESAARLNEIADTLAAEADRELAAAAEVAQRFSKHEPAKVPTSGQPLLDALQQGDLDDAADLLDELLGGEGTLSDAERESLGDSLRDLSRQLGAERRVDDAADPRDQRLGEALREHGLDPALIDSLLDRPSADRDEMERTLRDAGVDDEVAQRLSEDLEQRARERAVEERADDRAETIADALERSADQLDSGPSKGEVDGATTDDRRRPGDETGETPEANERADRPAADGEPRESDAPARPEDAAEETRPGESGSRSDQRDGDTAAPAGEEPSDAGTAERESEAPDGSRVAQREGDDKGETPDASPPESDTAGNGGGHRQGENGQEPGQPERLTEEPEERPASEPTTDVTGRPDPSGNPAEDRGESASDRMDSDRAPGDEPGSTDERTAVPGRAPEDDPREPSARGEMTRPSSEEGLPPEDLPPDQVEKLPLDKLPLDQLEKLPLDKLPLDQLEKLPLDKLPLDQLEKLPLDKLPLDLLEKLPLDKLPLDQLEKLPLDKLPLDQLEKLPLDKLPLDQLEKLPLDKLPPDLLEKLPMEELSRRLSETPPDTLRELARRLEDAGHQREVSEEARRIARELMDRAGGRQPERWGDRSHEPLAEREPGADPDADSPGGRGGPGAAGNQGTPDEVGRASDAIGRTTERVDLRGEELGDQVIATLLTEQEAPATSTAGGPAVERVRTAQRVAERAVNDSAVPSRYHRLINRYFGRLDETLDDARSGAVDPESADSDTGTAEPRTDDAGDS